MVIATFGSPTEWDGKTISFEDGQFTLEGHGPISAAGVMEYDRQGHLVWAYEGLRDWVGTRAGASPAERVLPTPLADRWQSPPLTGASRQTGGVTTPWGEISPLGIVGAVLVICAILAFAYLIAVYAAPVVPLALVVVVCILAAAAGGALLYVAYSRDELGNILKRGPAAGERKCPYCAERIKAEAVVCRHCNRDVPPDGRPSAGVST